MPRPSPQTERVVAIIDHLARCDDGATLTELAHAVGADRSALVHVLAALATAGVLYREPVDQRYHLGPALVRPGQVAGARYGDLAVVRTELEQAAEELGRACLSFEPEGEQGRLVQYVWPRGSTPPAIAVGETLPLRPPLGIIFVAWGSDADVDRWLALAPDLAPDRRDRLREQCAAIRRLGFVVEARPSTMEDQAFARLIDDRASPRRDGKLLALLADHGRDEHVLTALAGDDHELHLVHAIGAPCFDRSGRVSRTVSAIGFDEPLRTDQVHEVGRVVQAAAGRATAALGGVPPAPPARRPARART